MFSAPPGETIMGATIMPPPVNLQIEQEFNANPPWDAVAALGEATEEEPVRAEWLGVFGGKRVRAAESIFTEGWDWVKKNVKRIVAAAVGGVSTAVIGGVTLVATIGCFGAESELADEAECYKIATFGAGFTVAAAGTTVKAWYSLKENRP
jgi:hypothetical protein